MMSDWRFWAIMLLLWGSGLVAISVALWPRWWFRRG
jgi:hypothetical protein